jgi:hypothetical protein
MVDEEEERPKVKELSAEEIHRMEEERMDHRAK